MGSSAALVTSLVAALMAFFVPAMNFDEQQKDLELVHSLAQLSHCYVQRKVHSEVFSLATALVWSSND